MTTICPACDARFRDPPEDVVRTRPLQCSKCEHEWIPVNLSTGRVQVDSPPMAPEISSLIGNGPETIHTSLPVIMPKESEIPLEKEPLFVDRAPPQAKSSSSLAIKSTVAFLCLGLVATGVILKNDIMSQFPPSVAAFQTLGLANENAALNIANVVTTKSNRDGIRQLIVRGEIENVASNTVPVPPIKLTMRGESNSNLFAWTVSAAKPSLKAGEKSRFTAIAHNYPGDASNVEVEFEALVKKLEK